MTQLKNALLGKNLHVMLKMPAMFLRLLRTYIILKLYPLVKKSNERDSCRTLVISRRRVSTAENK